MRRIRLDLMKPAELAIYVAMGEVEKLPPDINLTKAVTLLAEAKELVSDFIDGLEIDPFKGVRFYKCPECGETWIIHSKSPEWLINQTNLGVHIRNLTKTTCRVKKFIEITKDEYFTLNESIEVKGG